MKKKRTTLYKKIIIPIYRQPLHICIYKDIESAGKALKKKGIEVDIEEDDLNKGAISYINWDDNNFGGIIIFDPNELTNGCISHEVDHVGDTLLNSIGMTKNDTSDEAYTYLKEYLVDVVTSIIKKGNIKIVDAKHID